MQPVYRPGAVPLRPLKLGDFYDASFKIIRFNAGATVGSSMVVSAVSMLIPTLAVVLIARSYDLSTDVFGEPMTESDVLLNFGPAVAGMGAWFFQSVGILFVTGMVAVVAQAAAVGQRLSLAGAWARTQGCRLSLLGLFVLVNVVIVAAFGVYVGIWLLLAVNNAGTGMLVLFGVLSIPAFVGLMVWAWVRLNYIVVPALMLERIGLFAAFGRSFTLTAGQFWRTFGIALLTAIIVGVAGQLLALPVTLIGAFAPFMFEPTTAAYVALVTQALGTVLAAAFTWPFAAAVASLQYVDQRMRKEGYDVELLAEAGITPS